MKRFGAPSRNPSAARGIHFDSRDSDFMLKGLSGIFAVGEMLNRVTPTGGYLLNACLATGLYAGPGILDWLRNAGE